MKKLILLCTFILASIFTQGQNKTENFERFVMKQDSLCMKAYEKLDHVHYQKLLNEFLEKYNKLSDSTKHNYNNSLNGLYYNFSCLYSLENKKEEAIKCLENSIKYGYSDYYHVLEDKDLDNLRAEKKYQTLVNYLQQIGDYKYILKKASKYNVSDNRTLPTFEYQSNQDSNLVKLRQAFRLDSIAGQGTDVLKTLNLLHWLHNLIPHDGNHENPTVKNAFSMIKECKRDNRTLNCRGLATVLNECYLSLGIKSRIVTCLPKDSLKIDADCHVINMVYAESLKKWLWIDPTFNAYVMNETGELLSIEEVRERIINNKSLMLNADANWNNKNPQTKEYYLDTYMAKNLYILECPVISEFDMETKINGKTYNYIKLLPLDYFEQSPYVIELKNNKLNTTIKTYKTNNPNLFWKSPN